jgi:hypothetical protein
MSLTNTERIAAAKANTVYPHLQQFHTLHDVFAYAFSVGMPSTEMSHIRRTLYNMRSELRGWGEA